MNFSQGVEYELKLNLHSKIMLAFRYGIAIEKEFVPAFFEGYEKSSNAHNSSKGLKCKFNIEGQKVIAVIKNLMLVTALPTSRIYDTADAKAVAVGFDFSLAMAPDLFTMQEIVDWRDAYLDSNGGIKKDDLRREIKKRAPDQRDPMQLLGLHDSFFDEVKELRDIAYTEARTRAARVIDFSDTNSVVENSDHLNRLRSLAKTDLTILWEETEEFGEIMRSDWEQYKKSDEFRDDMKEEHEQALADVLEQRSFPEPVYGVPMAGQHVSDYKGRPVYFYDDCVVTDIKISDWKDGRHEIHYRNEFKAFITTTQQKWIIDSYSVGQRGVYIIKWSQRVSYLQQFMGSDEESPIFSHSLKWAKTRDLVIGSSNGKCAKCGSSENLEVDHVRPRDLYPELEFVVSNLQVLCRKCNFEKGNIV